MEVAAVRAVRVEAEHGDETIRIEKPDEGGRVNEPRQPGKFPTSGSKGSA